MNVFPCFCHRRYYLKPTGAQVSQILVHFRHPATSPCCCYTRYACLLAAAGALGLPASPGEEAQVPSPCGGQPWPEARRRGDGEEQPCSRGNRVLARASFRAEGSAQAGGRGTTGLRERVAAARVVLGTLRSSVGRTHVLPWRLWTLKLEALLVLLPPSPIF